LAGFVLIWGLPWIVTPLSTDEAYYALGGRAVLQGDKLYADLWDIKPPLIYIVYAIPLGLFGDSSEGIRVFNLINAVGAVTAVYLFTRRYFGPRAAILGSAIYGFSYFILAGFIALGEAESFMAAPMLLAFALYKPRDESGARTAAVTAGLLLGVVVALKFSAVLLVLGLPLMEYLFRDRAGWTKRGAIERLSWAAGGFVAVQLGWIVYLLALGVFDDFLDIQANYTVPYARFRWSPEHLPYWRGVFEASANWLIDAPYITLPAWAAFAIGLIRGPRAPIVLLGALAFACVFAVWWQGKMFHYHWLIILPFLAPLAGYTFDQLLAAARPHGRGTVYAAAVLIVAGLLIAALAPAWRIYDDYGYLGKRLNGTLTQAQVEERYFGEIRLNREMMDYIRANGSNDDQFYIWGFWTTPYLWEDRPLVTRFVANHGLRSEWTPPEWRNELLDDLEAKQPRFVAIAAGDFQPWLTGTEESSDQFFCNRFPEFKSFVSESYQPVLNNGLFVLYDREAPEGTAFPRCAE
jgi:hypothetical protein